MNAADFIRRLPKAELHLHLEGSVPWDMIRERADIPLPETPEWWAGDFRYDDFDHLSQVMPLQRYVLNGLDRYHEVAGRIFRTLVEQNVRCVEISFGAEAMARNQLRIADVADAIKQAAPENLTVMVIGGFNRRFHYDVNDRLVQETLDAPIDGIDLHGKETLESIPVYAPIFEQARQKGLLLKAHAGEMLGPPTIWESCQHLNVRRIQHGVRAVEDESLVEYLVAQGVTLNLCLTSNLKLGVVKSLADHPIKTLFRQGVSVTVSTDDPTFFGCSLTDELTILTDELGFTPKEIAAVQKNAFRAAQMSADMRQAIFKEIDRLVEAFNGT